MYAKIFLVFLLLTSVAAQPGSGSGSTDICPVCLEDLALVPSTVTLECAHPLCLECYTGIYSSQLNPSCPLCRAPCSASPEQLQRRRPPPTPRPTHVSPLQPRGSNGATAPPPLEPLDDNGLWESIPPELLRPPIQQPVPTRLPCTPTPQPTPLNIDYYAFWDFLRCIFYIIDACMRVRRPS